MSRNNVAVAEAEFMMKLFTDNVGPADAVARGRRADPLARRVPGAARVRRFAIVRAASGGLSFRSAFAALNVPHGTSRAGRAEHERTLAGIARRRELRPRVECGRRADGGRHGGARDAQRRGPRRRPCRRRAPRSDVVRDAAPPARRDHGQAARPAKAPKACRTYGDSWIYDATTDIFADRDSDGYYRYLRVQFDADTIYTIRVRLRRDLRERRRHGLGAPVLDAGLRDLGLRSRRRLRGRDGARLGLLDGRSTTC